MMAQADSGDVSRIVGTVPPQSAATTKAMAARLSPSHDGDEEPPEEVE